MRFEWSSSNRLNVPRLAFWSTKSRLRRSVKPLRTDIQPTTRSPSAATRSWINERLSTQNWTRAGFTLLAASHKIEEHPRADVAQLVEQSIRNRQVIGSSPIVGSIIFCRLRSTPLWSSPDLENVLRPMQWARRGLGLASFLRGYSY